MGKTNLAPSCFCAREQGVWSVEASDRATEVQKVMVLSINLCKGQILANMVPGLILDSSRADEQAERGPGLLVPMNPGTSHMVDDKKELLCTKARK